MHACSTSVTEPQCARSSSVRRTHVRIDHFEARLSVVPMSELTTSNAHNPATNALLVSRNREFGNREFGNRAFGTRAFDPHVMLAEEAGDEGQNAEDEALPDNGFEVCVCIYFTDRTEYDQ